MPLNKETKNQFKVWQLQLTGKSHLQDKEDWKSFYLRIHTLLTSVFRVMVIVFGNGIYNLSLNPGRGSLRFMLY